MLRRADGVRRAASGCLGTARIGIATLRVAGEVGVLFHHEDADALPVDGLDHLQHAVDMQGRQAHQSAGHRYPTAGARGIFGRQTPRSRQNILSRASSRGVFGRTLRGAHANLGRHSCTI
ncbi:hypothetical protein [Azospirillum palustre]